jgi:hypothetical protein
MLAYLKRNGTGILSIIKNNVKLADKASKRGMFALKIFQSTLIFADWHMV